MAGHLIASSRNPDPQRLATRPNSSRHDRALPGAMRSEYLCGVWSLLFGPRDRDGQSITLAEPPFGAAVCIGRNATGRAQNGTSGVLAAWAWGGAEGRVAAWMGMPRACLRLGGTR